MALKLDHQCRNFIDPVTLVSRLHLDAQLYDWPEERSKGKTGAETTKREAPVITKTTER